MFLSTAFATVAMAAPQATATGGARNALATFIPLILIFVVFYVLLILPQQKKQKKHRQMIEALKRGDKVITMGGIHGTVTHVGETTVILKVADDVKIEVNKGAIATIKQ